MEPIRKRLTQEIDIKATMQAYAEKLIQLADAEKTIRSSRRYRKAVRAAFKELNVNRIITPVLVVVVARNLGATHLNYDVFTKEIGQHIRFNKGRYLRIVQGHGGGVELLKP